MIDFSVKNIRIWSCLGSCGAFGQAVLSLPESDDSVIVITADLCSFSGLERFKNKYPDLFYNVGIAEQNMVGIAAGFAKEGFNPFISTYASFGSMRSAEQVKICMGYMNLPIKLVGLTSGFSVGILGATHMCLEDISLIRAMPNIVIISPADSTATIKATIAAAQLKSPVYLRLTGGMNCPVVYKEDFSFEIGKAIQLKSGSDIAIIATGSMVYHALKAADILEEQGISACVIDMHTIKPLDLDVIKKVCSLRLIVTVEEHSCIGGLGSAVSEALSMQINRPPLLIMGVNGSYPHAGDYEYLLKNAGLNFICIAERILKTFKEFFDE